MTPNYLLNKVSGHLGCKNDAQLAKKLNLSPSTISCIRNYAEYKISSDILIKIYDATGWTIDHIRTLAGIPLPERN